MLKTAGYGVVFNQALPINKGVIPQGWILYWSPNQPYGCPSFWGVSNIPEEAWHLTTTDRDLLPSTICSPTFSHITWEPSPTKAEVPTCGQVRVTLREHWPVVLATASEGPGLPACPSGPTSPPTTELGKTLVGDFTRTWPGAWNAYSGGVLRNTKMVSKQHSPGVRGGESTKTQTWTNPLMVKANAVPSSLYFG